MWRVKYLNVLDIIGQRELESFFLPTVIVVKYLNRQTSRQSIVSQAHREKKTFRHSEKASFNTRTENICRIQRKQFLHRIGLQKNNRSRGSEKTILGNTQRRHTRTETLASILRKKYAQHTEKQHSQASTGKTFANIYRK